MMNDGNYNKSSSNLDAICVKLIDESELKGREIVAEVPFVSFLSRQHVDVCEYLAAQRFSSTSIDYKVYVNILVTHSVIAKIITAILFLIKSKRVDIIDWEQLPIDGNFHKNFGVSTPIGGKTNPNYASVDLIDKKHKWRLAGKFFLHRVYRAFSGRLNQSPALVRSWVEISKDFFAERYDTDYIAVYPFTLNWRRQVRYINQLREHKTKWRLWGLPYDCKTAVRVFFFMSVSDREVVNFEKEAYEKHAREIKSLGVSAVFTSDEFEAGAVAMHSSLRSEGISVKNVAHGLSFSCPFVSYDVFQVYNLGQRDYYKRKSDVAHFKVMPTIFSSTLVDQEDGPSAPLCIVFLDGNFKSSGLIFERKFQDRVVRSISQLASRTGIDFKVKAHPNLPGAEIRQMETEFGVAIEQSSGFLATVTPVFVTLFSAGYYDFRQYGDFLFVTSGVEDLSAIYGESVNQVSFANLDDAILRSCADARRIIFEH